MFVSNMLKKCSDFISAISTKDLSTNRCLEERTSTKPVCAVVEVDKNLEIFEDKENSILVHNSINLTLDDEMKLKNNIEINDSFDDLSSTITACTFNCNADAIELNGSIKEADFLDSSHLKIPEIGKTNFEPVIEDCGDMWTDGSEFSNRISNQSSTFKCTEKPRPSLLQSFDPLFGTFVNIKEPSVSSNLVLPNSLLLSETALLPAFETEHKENEEFTDAIKFCQDLIDCIIEEALFEVNCCDFNIIDTSDSKSAASLVDSIADMADIADKVKLSLHEGKEDISVLRYSTEINDKEKVALLEEQVSDLKLQLRQKEEMYVKNQAELKQLKEKLGNDGLVENDIVQDFKNRESKLLSEINTHRTDVLEYQKIMEEYEKRISLQVAQLQKLQEDNETVKRHLANLELAFSDVHQKYERTKKIIEGYKSNEDILKETLATAHDSVIKSEEKYETLKAHAKAQIEKSNQEIQAVREHYDVEVMKLNAIIRRLDIKINSLTASLDQKTKECVALSALYDEVTGQSVMS